MGDDRPVRDRLLDAAYELTVRWGWGKVRMADVAKAAGFSRQTVYDQFGGRDELAQELALRELDRFLDGLEVAMDGEDEVAAAIEAAARFALELAARNPLVRAIVAETDADGLLPLLTSHAEPVLFTARGRILDYLLDQFPQLDEPAAGLLAEVGTRLVLSYVVLSVEPPEVVAARLGALVTRLVAPEAEEVVAAGRS